MVLLRAIWEVLGLCLGSVKKVAAVWLPLSGYIELNALSIIILLNINLTFNIHSHNQPSICQIISKNDDLVEKGRIILFPLVRLSNLHINKYQ